MTTLLSRLRSLNWRMLEELFDTTVEEIDYHYNYACFFAKTGKKSTAFKYLESAFGDRPSSVRLAKKDSDLNNLRHDPEFTELIEKYSHSSGAIRPLMTQRMTILNLTSLFVIIAVILFLYSHTLGIFFFEIGVLIGFAIESIQAFIFRKRVFFTAFSIPLSYGLLVFSFVNLVFYHQGLIVFNPIIYFFIVLHEFVSLAFMFFVFRPQVSEFAAYRVQNLARTSLIYTLPLLVVLQTGRLLQVLYENNCIECVYLYSAQVAFFGGMWLLTILLFRTGVTLQAAQSASSIATIAFLIIMSITVQFSNIVQLRYVTWYIILYSITLFEILLLAIVEAYFPSQSESQKRFTRYVIVSYLITGALQISYTGALNGGLIPNSLPPLDNISLPLVVVINTFMIIALWTAFLKLKGVTVMGNYISISGVTSSSINVESPFATALTNLESTGKADLAITLLQLRDMVQAAQFNEALQRKQALEILEAISEEAQKPQPKKFSIMAMIPTLTNVISSAATISEKAPVLIEKLKGFWQ